MTDAETDYGSGQVEKEHRKKSPFSAASVPESDLPYSSINKLCELNRGGMSRNEHQENTASKGRSV